MSKYLFLIFLLSCTGKKPEVVKEANLNLHELAHEQWPPNFKGKSVEYVFDKDLISFLRKSLIESKSDQIAVSIIDNNTGNVLALIGRDNEKKVDNDNLSLKPFSPAASLIKVITSADLIEKHDVKLKTSSYFRGKKATLYKYQLENNKKGKETSLHQAFTSSNNVIFAKLAAEHSTALSLFETAENFYFNEQLPIQNIDSKESFFPVPESDYMFAELASGLNKQTMMSPLHAAYMMSGILNDGVLIPLTVTNGGTDRLVASFEPRRVLSSNSAKKLIEMMKSVVEKGTARSLTRKTKKKLRESLEFGGKTGRMTGGVPYGTRDWLAFYVKEKDKKDKGWSVAVMINNGERWTVRPTFIAKRILEYYYSKIINKNKV